MGQGSSTHPIHSAGRTGDVCVVRRYLKNSAILNSRDSDDMTCLHWAAQLGHIDIVDEVVEAGGQLDVQDCNGWTPLMHACCRGHKLVVGTLLRAGASLEIESLDGRTALHRATTWKRLGPLDQLIEAGANVHHEDAKKWTPLHCAAAAGDDHACMLLVDAGVDPDARDIFGCAPVDVIADISAAKAVKKALARAPRQRSAPNLPAGRLGMEGSGTAYSAPQNAHQDGSDKRPRTKFVHREGSTTLSETSNGMVPTRQSSTFDTESGCALASACGRRFEPQLPKGKVLQNGPTAERSSPVQRPPFPGSADLRLETNTLPARLYRDSNSAAGTKVRLGVTADLSPKFSGGVRATHTQDPSPKGKHSGKRKAAVKSTAVAVSSEGGDLQ